MAEQEIRRRDKEIDELVERQTKANEDIEEMVADSRSAVSEANARHDGCRIELDKLTIDYKKVCEQLDEVRGLYELFKDKYKNEKLHNRQAGERSSRFD